MSHSRALQHLKQRRSLLKLRSLHQDPRVALVGMVLQQFQRTLNEQRRRGDPPVMRLTIYTPDRNAVDIE